MFTELCQDIFLAHTSPLVNQSKTRGVDMQMFLKHQNCVLIWLLWYSLSDHRHDHQFYPGNNCPHLLSTATLLLMLAPLPCNLSHPSLNPQTYRKVKEINSNSGNRIITCASYIWMLTVSYQPGVSRNHTLFVNRLVCECVVPFFLSRYKLDTIQQLVVVHWEMHIYCI